MLFIFADRQRQTQARWFNSADFFIMETQISCHVHSDVHSLADVPTLLAWNNQGGFQLSIYSMF